MRSPLKGAIADCTKATPPGSRKLAEMYSLLLFGGEMGTFDIVMLGRVGPRQGFVGHGFIDVGLVQAKMIGASEFIAPYNAQTRPQILAKRGKPRPFVSW